MTFGAHAIAHGDVLAALKELPDNEFDGLFCDPPYGFSFMGKKWDYDVPSVDVWRECLRVLKPGAPLLAFGGARTFHRIAIGIEDAGFEMRDCLMWLYAKGFPKGARVDNELWKRNLKCLSQDNVKHVVQCSPVLRLTSKDIALATARILPEGAPALLIRIGREDGSGVLMAMSLSPTAQEAIASSTTLSWSENWGDDYAKARTSITSTELETTTEERILSSLTGLLTFASTIPPSNNPTHGATAHAYLVEHCSSAARNGLKLIPALTALDSATCEAWHGYNLALKPAYEPIILARKPMDGTVANNVARWGVGGLAIDACRIGEAGGTTKANCPKEASKGIYGNGINGACDIVDIGAGRWPANLLLDEDAAAQLDASVAPTKSTPYPEHSADGAVLPLSKRTAGGYADSGGPSRFFYTAKVSTKEREYGCEALPQKTAGEVTGDREEDSIGLLSPRAGAGRTGGARNHHPTLKPISLARWLASLIKPPTQGATLLIPYSGAGSEIIGALQAGWPLVFGIEGEAEYVDIAHARIAAWGNK